MLRKLLMTTLVACLAVPAGAQAASDNRSIMMDDDLLLYRGDATRTKTLLTMRALGVDTVRVSVLWSIVADRTKRLKRPHDPRSYPAVNWHRYDGLARDCMTYKMTCYFNVTPPGPKWAHRRGRSKTWKPSAKHFGRFVQAVGKRYSGDYIDENGHKLPRVSFWAIGNEPNQQGWLTPQWERRGGIRYNAAAKQYRDLWRYGYRGLHKTGHRKDTILMAETAPLGSRRRSWKSPTYPKTFVRELFCLDEKNRRFRGKQARVRDCRRMPKFRATAFAHHAYTKTLSPRKKDRSKNSVTMANINDLSRLLDRAAKRTKRIKRRMPLMITEFGYETNPPDPRSKISFEEQAEYINVADYLAYRNRRIEANTQFLLQDVAPQDKYPKDSKKYWFTYQSGLFTQDGTAKPAVSAYALPLVMTKKSGNSVRFWGQLRFMPDGLPTQAQLEFKPRGSNTWQPAGGPFRVTDKRHYFNLRRTAPGDGSWRVTWTGPGQTFTSREVSKP